MMKTTQIEKGSKWFAGNTYSPSIRTVVGTRKWEQLSAKQKRTQIIIHSYQKKAEDFATTDFVLFTVHGEIGVLPYEVFAATHYETLDQMIEAYAR